MLQLENIRKSYTTANFTQNALDGVSISFRANEFTAILGPSGSGKTTMLNIIGGLDQCDSGDLKIDNISTKKYKDRDWDTYRNNRIGFVFQSYNLIPHQSILSNVELALTLSGVSKSERRERAIQALTEVGLELHIRKRPNQLSGGQMQRVAIARALVNDPEILLADEPTGAVDTKTSVQIMDLLTRIAKDRLVIMVTHNNELAQQYANRIIHLRDGKVESDSRPYNPPVIENNIGDKIRKSGMSFITAISLSFSNLMTKKGRTFVTSLAGSIGIVGIATILALANGINQYIQRIEEETLSLYPLMIQTAGIDFSAMFGGGSGTPEEREARRLEVPPDHVRERRVAESLFSSININDLASLKTYFEETNDEIASHVTTIHYMYNVTPQIFLADTTDGPVQVNPDEIFADSGMGAGGGGMGFGFGMMGGMNVFHEMPNEPSLFENQYEILAGHWPTNYDELVLVLSHGGAITDFELYTMGLRDRSELSAMLEAFMEGTEVTLETEDIGRFYSHETLMSVEFKVITPAELYQYDAEFNVWVDRSNDEAFMQNLVDNALTLRIVGIVQPDPNANVAMLSQGINYKPELIIHLIEQASRTQIVRDQKAQPEVNVITGRTFEEEEDDPDSRFDFSRIISVDEDILADLFDFEFDEMDFDPDNLNFDASRFNFDTSGFNLDPSNFDFDLSNMNLDLSNLGDLNFDIDASTLPMPEFDLGALLVAIADQVDVDANDLNTAVTNIINDFMASGFFNPAFPSDIPQQFADYLASPTGQLFVAQQLSGLVDPDLEDEISAIIQDFLAATMQAYMEQVMAIMAAQMQQALSQAIGQAMQQAMEQIMQQLVTTITNEIQRAMSRAMNQISNQIQSAIEDMFTELFDSMEDMFEDMFDFDEEAFAEAFQITMGEEEVLDLMTSIMNPSVSTFERNLSLLGYADLGTPSQINIYPRNFESKQEILDILEQYNARMEENGTPEKVVRFIDIVGVMMASVTDIVDLVSYGLIAFVSISLVVSSIMIGVITFISVLERKKEIGILRAIGASKQNIRTVFNAEALIIGFVAGVLGVLITLLIVFVGNIILYERFDIVDLAQLPAIAAFVLVCVSMFLTFIAGLMPASAAARKDPVEALRSE